MQFMTAGTVAAEDLNMLSMLSYHDHKYMEP